MQVTVLTDEQVELVDAHLPLHRLDQYRAGLSEGRSLYLIAWEGDTPVGHGHLAWPGPHLEEPGRSAGLPELQDVFVPPERRRRGIASALTLAAEREAARRGFDRLALSVGVGNEPARRLYERLGYVDAGYEPVRKRGTIVLRGVEHEIDDVLVYLVKPLAAQG